MRSLGLASRSFLMQVCPRIVNVELTGREMRSCSGSRVCSFFTSINMPREAHERGIGSNINCDCWRRHAVHEVRVRTMFNSVQAQSLLRKNQLPLSKNSTIAAATPLKRLVTFCFSNLVASARRQLSSLLLPPPPRPTYRYSRTSLIFSDAIRNR
jgi:hypothetical protein